MKPGFEPADRLLCPDIQAVGAIEARAEGTLAGVEAQTAKYAAGLPDDLPAPHRPLPFLIEFNGAVTFCTNGLDPTPRSADISPISRTVTGFSFWSAPATSRSHCGPAGWRAG